MDRDRLVLLLGSDSPCEGAVPMLPAKLVLLGRITVLGLLVLVSSVNTFASGPVEKVIHKFTGSPDGTTPLGALVPDQAGNLYGTAPEGGFCRVSTHGCGVVFELSPPAILGGDWTETILYTFTGGSDGANPKERSSLTARAISTECAMEGSSRLAPRRPTAVPGRKLTCHLLDHSRVASSSSIWETFTA